MYGDGLFETMRGYGGRVFALKEHLERLKASASFLEIPVSLDPRKMHEIIFRLLELNGLDQKDSRIRLTVLRGEGRGGLMPDKDAPSEVIISAENIKDIHEKGVSLRLIRNIRIDNRSPLTSHKTLGYLPGILGLMEVREKGADEGLFLNHDGMIAEGVTSNFFMVKKGVLITPPLSAGILPGITRGHVINAAKEIGLNVVEKGFSEDELFKGDEFFITSSVREIAPVRELEGISCEAGRITGKIRESFRRRLKRFFLTGSER